MINDYKAYKIDDGVWTVKLSYIFEEFLNLNIIIF
jgi:hypothetical protein